MSRGLIAFHRAVLLIVVGMMAGSGGAQAQPDTVYVDVDRLLAPPFQPEGGDVLLWSLLPAAPSRRSMGLQDHLQAPSMPVEGAHRVAQAQVRLLWEKGRRPLERSFAEQERGRWSNLGEAIGRSRQGWREALRRDCAQQMVQVRGRGWSSVMVRAESELAGSWRAPSQVLAEQRFWHTLAHQFQQNLAANRQRHERWERRWHLFDLKHQQEQAQAQLQSRLEEMRGELERQRADVSPTSATHPSRPADFAPAEGEWRWETSASAPSAPATPSPLLASSLRQRQRNALRGWVERWAAAQGWQVVFEPQAGVLDVTEVVGNLLWQDMRPSDQSQEVRSP